MRTVSKRLVLPLVFSIFFCCILAGQEPPTGQGPTIRTTTREVILDVVVRDKHHHAIGDLRPSEIEVYEMVCVKKSMTFAT